MERMTVAKFYYLALVLAVAFGLSSSSTEPRLRKHHVKFINKLDNKVLNVNCKNLKPYIDLELHILLPAEEYEFDYNVTRTTAFTCDLRHGSTSSVFPISDGATRRQCGGNQCIWKAQDDGVYLLNRKTNQYKLKYHWG